MITIFKKKNQMLGSYWIAEIEGEEVCSFCKKPLQNKEIVFVCRFCKKCMHKDHIIGASNEITNTSVKKAVFCTHLGRVDYYNCEVHIK